MEGISGGTHESGIRITSLVSDHSVTYLTAGKITPGAIEWNPLEMISWLSFYQIDEGNKILQSNKHVKSIREHKSFHKYFAILPS